MEFMITIIVGLISTMLGAFGAVAVKALRATADLAERLAGFSKRADEQRLLLTTYRLELVDAAGAITALRGLSEAELARMNRWLAELSTELDRCRAELAHVREEAREADSVARQALAAGEPRLLAPEGPSAQPARSKAPPHPPPRARHLPAPPPHQHRDAMKPPPPPEEQTEIMDRAPLTRRSPLPEPAGGPNSGQTIIGMG